MSQEWTNVTCSHSRGDFLVLQFQEEEKESEMRGPSEIRVKAETVLEFSPIVGVINAIIFTVFGT